MKNIIVLFIALMGCLCLNAEVRIHMEKEAGVYKVPCEVNGLKMKFIFDTGAANVSMSSTYAEMMLENGYLVESDFKGTMQSILADGSVVDNVVVNLKKVEIGGQTIENVAALVVPSQNAPLLLGQSVIQRLGKVSIDGDYLVIHSANTYNEKEILSFFSKANSFFDNQIYSEALKYYNIVYEYYGDKTDPGVLYTMSNCCKKLNDEDSALGYLYLAIDLDNGENHDGILFDIYESLYYIYCLNDNHSRALECAKLMENYAINISERGQAYANLGEINNLLDNYVQALSYTDKSIANFDQLKKKRKLDATEYMHYVNAVIEKGKSLLYLKKFDEAIKMFTLGKRVIGQIKNGDNYQEFLDECNLGLSECYENLANH